MNLQFFSEAPVKKKHTTHPTTNWGVSQAVDPSSPGAGTRFLAMVPAMERGGRAHRCEFHRRILTLTMDVYVFWLKKNMGLFRTATWWCENFMIHRGYVVYPCLSMIFNMKTMISCWDHLGSHINKDPHKFPDEQDVDVDLDLLQRYQRCPC